MGKNSGNFMPLRMMRDLEDYIRPRWTEVSPPKDGERVGTGYYTEKSMTDIAMAKECAVAFNYPVSPHHVGRVRKELIGALTSRNPGKSTAGLKERVALLEDKLQALYETLQLKYTGDSDDE